MSSHRHDEPSHPVARAVAGARGLLTEVVETPVWSLTGAQLLAAQQQASRLAAQVAEVEARLLQQVETSQGFGASGATSAANWLAHHLKHTRQSGHRVAALGEALGRYEAIRTALARGVVLPDQARVITAALDALPDDADVRTRAEKHLLTEAHDHDAKDLKTIGAHVLAVVDPEAGEAHEAALLEAEERQAA